MNLPKRHPRGQHDRECPDCAQEASGSDPAHLAEGAEVGPDDVIEDVCPARLLVRPVDLSWRMTSMFAVSDEFYGFVRPPYLQVVWADKYGRVPWEPRFQAAFCDAA